MGLTATDLHILGLYVFFFSAMDSKPLPCPWSAILCWERMQAGHIIVPKDAVSCVACATLYVLPRCQNRRAVELYKIHLRLCWQALTLLQKGSVRDCSWCIPLCLWRRLVQLIGWQQRWCGHCQHQSLFSLLQLLDTAHLQLRLQALWQFSWEEPVHSPAGRQFLTIWP